MKKPIAIYGAGGLGREVLGLIKALPEWEPIGFYDDGLTKGAAVESLQVLGSVHELRAVIGNASIVVAAGSPSVKKKMLENLKGLAIDFPVLIHPSAIIQNFATVVIGAGTIITAGCILTTSIKIEGHVLLNLNSTIGHDCTIGYGSCLMPGVNVAGQVRVGSYSLIGSGAQIINRVVIGDGAVVGAGAVVLQDVRPLATVVGVPAREIKGN